MRRTTFRKLCTRLSAKKILVLLWPVRGKPLVHFHKVHVHLIIFTIDRFSNVVYSSHVDMTDSRIDNGDYGEMASVDYEVETTDYQNPYSDTSSSYSSSDSSVSEPEPHDNN